MMLFAWVLTTVAYAAKPATIEYQQFTLMVAYEVPTDAPTWFKAWMPHTSLTNKESDQYRLQQEAYTDEDGFRRIGDDYMVAMGSYYTTQCGDRFQITLEDDSQFTVTVGDAKADCDTDESGQYHPIYIDGELALANVLEFIVDTEVMDEDVLNTGTICSLGFEGNIVAIEKILINEKRSNIEENNTQL